MFRYYSFNELCGRFSKPNIIGSPPIHFRLIWCFSKASVRRILHLTLFLCRICRLFLLHLDSEKKKQTGKLLRSIPLYSITVFLRQVSSECNNNNYKEKVTHFCCIYIKVLFLVKVCASCLYFLTL